MKYVVFKDHVTFYPVLIAEHTTHTQVILKGCKAISAGFVDITKSSVRCFGESVSLNLKSRGKKDEDLIRDMLSNCGIYAFMDYDSFSAD